MPGIIDDEVIEEINAMKLPFDNTAVERLNQLLLIPGHYQHQMIARLLQDIKSPSTIPYIEKVLESNFSSIDFNGSDDAGMAKWFSWILFEIGNSEAIELMEKFSMSDNEAIKNEMIYRLSKIGATRQPEKPTKVWNYTYADFKRDREKDNGKP